MFRDPLPAIVQLLAGLWGLDEEEARRWWGAVAGARWSEVRGWRQQLLLAERVGDPEALASSLLAPCSVVRIMELLHGERRLSRRQTNQLETCVLAHVTAQGTWK